MWILPFGGEGGKPKEIEGEEKGEEGNKEKEKRGKKKEIYFLLKICKFDFISCVWIPWIIPCIVVWFILASSTLLYFDDVYIAILWWMVSTWCLILLYVYLVLMLSNYLAI